MTDGRLDMHDMLEALGPHGWRRAISFWGLVRLGGNDPDHYERIEVKSTGRMEYSRVGVTVRTAGPAERRSGTVMEVLSHVVARYANAAKEAA